MPAKKDEAGACELCCGHRAGKAGGTDYRKSSPGPGHRNRWLCHIKAGKRDGSVAGHCRGPGRSYRKSVYYYRRGCRGLKFYTSGSSGFVDVEDVAKAMIALMNSEIHAERFIVSAENRDYKQITAEIANGFGINPPAWYATPFMLGLGWRAAALIGKLTGKPPGIDKVSAQAASVIRNYDNSKIKK